MANIDKDEIGTEPTYRRRRHVLLVSSDHQLVTLIARYFRDSGMDVTVEQTIGGALGASSASFDLAVLEIDAQNGLRALTQFAGSPQVPTIALSEGRAGVAELLRAGADSVITEPFSVDVLDAHVEALLRRALDLDQGRSSRRPYVYQDLVVDFDAHVVTLGGRRLHLSAIQYSIVDYLSRNAGAVVTRRQFSESVWGPGYDASNELVRSHIRNLRRLLGDSADNPRFIRTERQIGYWMPPSQR